MNLRKPATVPDCIKSGVIFGSITGVGFQFAMLAVFMMQGATVSNVVQIVTGEYIMLLSFWLLMVVICTFVDLFHMARRARKAHTT